MRAKTFDEATHILQKEYSAWWVVRERGSYDVVGGGRTWQEACKDLPKKAKVLNRETHVCEAKGCNTKTPTGFCPYHHFTKEDGTPRAVGILGLPLE